MALRIVTPPAEEPLTREEVKAFLRVDHSDDDALIDGLIKASRQYLDGDRGKLNRCLVTQEWELVLDEFPSEIQIPLAPLRSVSSIKYDDADGVEQTLATDQYTVDTANSPGWVLPGDDGWPTTISAANAVRVRFVAGYEPGSGSPIDLAENIPETLKIAMKFLIQHWYDNRETVVDGVRSEPPYAVKALIEPYILYL